MPSPIIEELDRRYDDGIDGLSRSMTVKVRKAIPLEDFAWPEERKYPIDSQDHLDATARLIGRAPQAMQAKIKSNAIAIAKRKGYTLPDTWQVAESAKRADASDDAHMDDADELLDALSGDTSGEEDNAADEDTDESDDEDGKGDPDLSPEDARAATAFITRADDGSGDVRYYAPIARINKARREILGVATAEVKDAYRTVIGYEASKDAFARWAGNIREMHQSKAVGRALEITPDDARRRIIVRARISKGAEDTWQKILDGTLTGFSIGGKNGTWTKRVVGGEELDYLERYDQAELSVVDNPACPGATFDLVRADGMASAILAKDTEMDPVSHPSMTKTDVTRAGRRISKETQDTLHSARDHASAAHKQAAEACGCDECNDHIKALNKIAAHDDNDGDIDANELAKPAALRTLIADSVRSEVAEALRSQLGPAVSRVNALLASEASREDSDVERRVEALSEQLGRVLSLVEAIAAQPADGGPVLHGGSGVAQDKRLATQSSHARTGDADIIRRAMEMGFAPPSDPNDAIRAAAQLVRPIPR